MSLATIQIETQNDPDCAVIWLHGLGANGYDFEPIVAELNLPASVKAKFIFPHAPVQAVSLNNGMQMPAWYDIYGLEKDSKEDTAGIKKISEEINALVQQVIDDGIAANKIVLAGFSQGGALTLYTGLSYKQRLGGLLALSCYLPMRDQLENFAKDTQRDLPIFMAHGTYDDVVAHAFANLAQKLLETQGFKVDWHNYPCAHTVCAEEIQDIRNFLIQCWQ
ncbi:MAG: alpha/beta hydrolase [Gammaproteobacteria bacterium]|nr:alpha/beta hydrolase [Gammaproteobacteria bacterium]